MLLLLACNATDGDVDFGSSPARDDTEAEAHDSPRESSPADTGPFPVAVAGGTPLMGSPPLSVSFQAQGSTSPTGVLDATWSFSDGGSAEGLDVDHTFDEAGVWTATLTIDDGAGHEASDSVDVFVRSPDCPRTGSPSLEGQLQDAELSEVSGVVASHANPGVLWVHNDAGHDPTLYALSESGVMLGRYSLPLPRSDWEDLALMKDGEAWLLVVGDIGDNSRARTSVQVHLVPEPEVSPTQDLVEIELTVSSLDLTYPEDPQDAESIFVDPDNNDIYIVTKSWDGASFLARKQAPHEAGSSSELELLFPMDFSAPPLDGKATTAADISPDGSRILVRTYQQEGWLWERAEGQSIPEAMQGIPCSIELPLEPQGESVAFSPDGEALWTISERTDVPIYRTPWASPDEE
jgi:PKD repeat protein